MLELQKIFLTVRFFNRISCNKGLKAKISCSFSFFSVNPPPPLARGGNVSILYSILCKILQLNPIFLIKLFFLHEPVTFLAVNHINHLPFFKIFSNFVHFCPNHCTVSLTNIRQGVKQDTRVQR